MFDNLSNRVITNEAIQLRDSQDQVQILKSIFSSSITKALSKLDRLLLASSLHPCTIFESKARSLPYKRSPRALLGQAPIQTHRY